VNGTRLDYDSLETLKRIHPAWRLLAADHAPFILGFFQRCFIEPNLRSTGEQNLVSKLEDYMFQLRERQGEDAFPRPPKEYLDEWASEGKAWLRKYYPPGEDEPHFDLTPSAEKALEWAASLGNRAFVGTESRLRTVFELLRQMAEGAESDPEVRIAELEKRRSRIEAEIGKIREGRVELLDATALKERFLLMAATARGLLSDFREVEQNFRDLDRSVRDRIATWEGAKGFLLEEIFGTRDAINDSDQGRSFRAFWDFLMSSDRQNELSSLLESVFDLPAVADLAPDRRLLRIHYDWLQAGESAQRTIARLSEQLRRYLDDRTLMENRRIAQILKGIEQHAIALREAPPPGNMAELDACALDLELHLSRPLFSPPVNPVIGEEILLPGEQDIPSEALYRQEYVDKERLKGRLRKALQARDQVSLEDLIGEYPLEQGLSELIAYLAIAAEEGRSVIQDSPKQTLRWTDRAGSVRQATLPLVIFIR
jgi:flagellar motility protein MotE (MotC chaperone)